MQNVNIVNFCLSFYKLFFLVLIVAVLRSPSLVVLLAFKFLILVVLSSPSLVVRFAFTRVFILVSNPFVRRGSTPRLTWWAGLV